MKWQQKYESGDKLFYAGVACIVSEECYVDRDPCEHLDLTCPMQVCFIQEGLPAFKRVSWSHKHLIKRDLTEEAKAFDKALV